jgi:hypothetical protein
MIKAFSPIRWLFAPPTASSAGRIILWWEVRRIPVNLLVGAYGLICLRIICVAIAHSGVLRPGEDAFEPIPIIQGLIAFNLCYTLGWILDILTKGPHSRPFSQFSPRLLLAGLVFSFSIITLPTLMWVGYVDLQGIGLVK